MNEPVSSVSRPRAGLSQRARGMLGSRRIVAAVSLAVTLSIWEVYGRAYPLFVSYPSAIAAAATQVLLPEIIPAWQSTLVGFFIGLAIAIPVAQLIGIAMGRLRLIDIMLAPYVNALYVTPRIALIPLLVLAFGLDMQLRISIVVLSAIFPMIVNTYTGMRNVDRELLDVGRVFTANGPQRLRTIILPGSVPYVFAGLRLGVARALGGIIMAELSASITGIGRRLLDYGQYFQTDRLFVTIISIGVFGLVMTKSMAALQRRAAPWAHGTRTQ
jgi:ABC-type nitrate/sulfonate/bicarbonate transport system permease component